MNSVVDINSYCKQRKLRLQYNVPITRFTKVSPYSLGFTKHDLDMRRKAEVLKHSGPQKSTQANKLTKAQKFAQTVRGYSPQQKNLDPFTGKFKEADLAFCESSLNRVLTSSSDVPGPITSLYLDPSIPLYNYAPPDRTFSENVKENELPFRFFVNSENSSFLPGISQNIGALEILDKIPNSSTVFELVVPYTQGTIINNPVLYVTYSGSPILINNYTYDYTQEGTLLIKNITLYTTAGYFFEFALQFNDESITINTEGITIYNP
jgi:hypothetical protein